MNALTTTIPAQFVKKFNCLVVPIYIEREENNQFKIEIMKPLKFPENESIEIITTYINKIIEEI